MKALLALRWDEHSRCSDFEQTKGDFADELKGELVDPSVAGALEASGTRAHNNIEPSAELALPSRLGLFDPYSIIIDQHHHLHDFLPTTFPTLAYDPYFWIYQIHTS